MKLSVITIYSNILRVVKYWNKLPASVVTATSIEIFKKRLKKVWTEVFLHCLKYHLPNPSPSNCTSFINSPHLYMLPKSLFCLCGLFRAVVAYFLPL